MASPVVSLSLPQMVDLALGSPEVGSVNFNILHSLLHVMIQQLELQQCAVEFRGPDSERIQAAIAGSAAPAAKLSEYRVRDRSRKDKEIAKQAAQDDRGATETGELDEDRRGRTRTRAARAARDLPSSASSSSTSVSDGHGAGGTRSKGRKGCRRLLGLEDAEEVLRHSRRRRFSAHLLEVLASSHRLGRLSEDAASTLQSQVRVVEDSEAIADPTKRTRMGLEERAEAVESEIAKLTAQGEDAFRRLRVLEGALEDALEGAHLGRKPRRRASRDTATTGNKVGLGEQGSSDTPPTWAPAAPTAAATLPDADLSGLLRDEHLLLALKSKMAVLAPTGVPALPERARGWTRGSGRWTGGSTACRSEGTGLESLVYHAVRTKRVVFQEDLDGAVSHIGILFRERDQRALAVQGLQTQVQALEKHKADRWQLEAALAEKADRGLVSAKVSHTEFTAACTNIHNDLGQAKSKLHETESRLDSKLDRTELPAVAAELAEHVERLVAERPCDQARQQQLAQQAQTMQAEHFAAATKVRLIRNVTCISCDGPRAMRCDDWCPAVPTCESFPDRRPTRPYLGGQPCQATPPR
ncbi:uncharacterized protein LOC113210531, partial [Frankliniella occidentalis]|uniref:Uncharacterized protein LOC113210531 n=1 Tax=Frankliniella occidentalis TaxID=133901 RepID=A0A9C6XCM0_FRAOC